MPLHWWTKVFGKPNAFVTRSIQKFPSAISFILSARPWFHPGKNRMFWAGYCLVVLNKMRHQCFFFSALSKKAEMLGLCGKQVLWITTLILICRPISGLFMS